MLLSTHINKQVSKLIFATKSEQDKYSSVLMLIAKTFNTIFMLIIVNTNFVSKSSIFAPILSGNFSDFSPKWYDSVGVAIYTTSTVAFLKF